MADVALSTELITTFMELSPPREADSQISHFMEPEGSLSSKYESDTGFYPGPDECST
jgi:hypothetical protein